MPFGYMGKIGWVDLSRGEARTVDLDEVSARKYLGGKGLGAHLLYENMKPRTDPFDPENLLIFMTGPLTGTTFPAASRSAVITRSPLTGTFLDTYSGGSFGPKFKYAGYDAVVIMGKAEGPVYLKIDRGKIEIEDAADLWGLSTTETEERLASGLQESPGEKVGVASIGPGGEKRVRFACIIAERRAFGRGGAGAVMGSKNLKALLVRGNERPRMADEEAFKRVEKRCRQQIADHPMTGKNGVFPRVGTMMTVDLTQETGTFPTRNWQENTFEEVHSIDAEAFEKHIIRSRTCFACPIGCSRDTKGVWNGQEIVTEGPEYETIFALGSNCGIGETNVVISADRLCDDYGLDTISCGGVIGFAMECFEKGLIDLKHTGGIDLRFGNGDALLQLIPLIAKREGIGDILAEGVKGASERIEGSAGFAVHVKGMELPGYDPRGMKGQGLTYAVSDRGGCHMRSNTLRTELLGLPEPVDRFGYEDKAEMVRNLQLGYATFDCLGACAFGAFAMTPQDYADAVSALSGWSFSKEELNQAAERSWNLTRLFNVREGFSKKDDRLPRRLFLEASQTGPSKGQTVDEQAFQRMLDEYYEIVGWDKETGVPTEKKLAELGLLDLWGD